jgi:hypothetical protein
MDDLENVMTEKSHVSMEQHVCLVCGSMFDTGTILLDRRLQATLEQFTVTGWGLCPEHQALFDDGYVAIVECDPEKSGRPSQGDLVKPSTVFRTGKIAHVKRDSFDRIFDLPRDDKRPCVFVEPRVIEMLQALAEAFRSQ